MKATAALLQHALQINPSQKKKKFFKKKTQKSCPTPRWGKYNKIRWTNPRRWMHAECCRSCKNHSHNTLQKKCTTFLQSSDYLKVYRARNVFECSFQSDMRALEASIWKLIASCCCCCCCSAHSSSPGNTWEALNARKFIIFIYICIVFIYFLNVKFLVRDGSGRRVFLALDRFENCRVHASGAITDKSSACVCVCLYRHQWNRITRQAARKKKIEIKTKPTAAPRRISLRRRQLKYI